MCVEKHLANEIELERESNERLEISHAKSRLEMLCFQMRVVVFKRVQVRGKKYKQN